MVQPIVVAPPPRSSIVTAPDRHRARAYKAKNSDFGEANIRNTCEESPEPNPEPCIETLSPCHKQRNHSPCAEPSIVEDTKPMENQQSPDVEDSGHVENSGANICPPILSSTSGKSQFVPITHANAANVRPVRVSDARILSVEIISSGNLLSSRTLLNVKSLSTVRPKLHLQDKPKPQILEVRVSDASVQVNAETSCNSRLNSAQTCGQRLIVKSMSNVRPKLELQDKKNPQTIESRVADASVQVGAETSSIGNVHMLQSFGRRLEVKSVSNVGPKLQLQDQPKPRTIEQSRARTESCIKHFQKLQEENAQLSAQAKVLLSNAELLEHERDSYSKQNQEFIAKIAMLNNMLDQKTKEMELAQDEHFNERARLRTRVASYAAEVPQLKSSIIGLNEERAQIIRTYELRSSSMSPYVHAYM